MKRLIVISSIVAATAGLAAAAPFVFNNGDVVLGFQATGGTGSDKNVFFRIGAGTALRDGTISGTLGNINTTLTATFGANWYNRSDLYCGAFGNLDILNPTGSFGEPPVNGDPSRTVYLTKAAPYPRGGEFVSAGTFTSGSLGSAGNNFAGMETIVVLLDAEADTSAVLSQPAKPVEWSNGWTTWNPVPGAAFGTINGGIQQNFGKTTSETYLDLQRILPTNTGASPTGTVGGGDYVATIYIGNDGTIKVRRAPFVFDNGDVVLGFQATSGEGSDKNVFFRLGSSIELRDGLVTGTIGNIGNTLAATFGANWYSRTDLYCGAFGNLNSDSPSGAFGTPPVAGDPSRTFYLTKPATFPKEGDLIPADSYVSSALGSIGTKYTGMESMLATLLAEPDRSTVLSQAAKPVEWNNSWTLWNPVPGPAFDNISGGIQQNFGKPTSSTYLDLQRMLATNTGASPTGVAGGTTFVTTISISSTGAISLASASPFQNWLASFPSLTDPSDLLTTADPDGDSVSNIEEFAFGGNPANASDSGQRLVKTEDADGDTIPDLTLTLEVRNGVEFSTDGADLVAEIDNVIYRIEGSTNLVDWNSPVSEVAPASGTPSAGYVLKTFRLNAGEGLTGKGFLRAGVAK